MKCSASSLLNKNNYDSSKLVIAYFPFTLNLSGKGGEGEGEGRKGGGGSSPYISMPKKAVQRKPFFDILKSLKRLQEMEGGNHKNELS